LRTYVYIINMRIPFVSILIFFGFACLSGEERAVQQLFSAGNELYEQGKYAEAIDMYEKIVEKRISNGALFYNLANSHFREGNIGYSILYYEKARRLLPRDRELCENYQFVKNLLKDRIQGKKESFLVLIITALLSKFTSKEIVSFVSVFFSITLLVSILFFKYKHSNFLKNFTTSLFILFVFFVFLMYLKIRDSTVKTGVIIAQVADIMSAPSQESTLEFSIHEGTEFIIIESLKEWVKIKLLDGKTGWTEEGTFGRI